VLLPGFILHNQTLEVKEKTKMTEWQLNKKNSFLLRAKRCRYCPGPVDERMIGQNRQSEVQRTRAKGEERRAKN